MWNVWQDNVVLSPGKIKQLIVPMPAPPSDEPTKPYMFNSQDEARKLFECLLHPVKVDKFFLYCPLFLLIFARFHGVNLNV